MRALTAVLLMTLLVPAHSAHAALDYRGTAVPRREVEALFAGASAHGDSAATARGVEALERRLQNGGWLDARVDAVWDSAASTLRVSAFEGRRSRWGGLEIQAPAAAESARIAAAVELRPGGWASPATLAAVMDRAVHALADHGYPYARLAVARWRADSGGVSVALEGSTGPLVTITATRVEGLKVTQPRIAARALGRLTGAPWDRAAAEAARDRLDQLGLFRSVSLVGLEGEPEWSRARLVYRVEEPRYNRFEGVAGLQGAAGVAGQLNLELGNLLGTGRTAALLWESRGKGLAQFEARYAEPLVFGRPLRIEGAVSQLVQDTLYTRSTARGTARWSLPAGETIEGAWEQERVVQPHGDLERSDIQTTRFAFERTTFDRRDAPRHGTRLRVAGAQTFERQLLRPVASHRVRASTGEAEGQWIVPLRSTFASIDVRGAARFGTERVLASYQRFPLGGAATLRGYDEEAFRVDRYALSRLEWGWWLGGAQRAFLFWDHAWTATREALPAPDAGDRLSIGQHDGFGAGLRIDTPNGIVGIDYGLAAGRAVTEGKLHLMLVSTF